MRETLTVSERRACRVLGQVRRIQRYTLKMADDETVLTENIVYLASGRAEGASPPAQTQQDVVQRRLLH